MSNKNIRYVPVLQPGMVKPEDNPAGWRNPRELALRYEDVYMKTADGFQIHAWWMPAKAPADGKAAPTILFCHANAGNIGHRLPNFADLVKTCGANVFAFDYRGFGNSEGKPSEEGIILDGLASLKELKKRFKIDEVFIFGRSLGGAVAVSLVQTIEEYPAETKANFPRIRGVMLENTFTSNL